MSTGVVTIPTPTEAAPAEPEIANIGGDQPPMEYSPAPSAVKVTPPPHARTSVGHPAAAFEPGGAARD